MVQLPNVRMIFYEVRDTNVKVHVFGTVFLPDASASLTLSAEENLVFCGGDFAWLPAEVSQLIERVNNMTYCVTQGIGVWDEELVGI